MAAEHGKCYTAGCVTSWSKVSLIDAGRFDVNTAYAKQSTEIRCDDMHPHIYKTNDGGKTWTAVVNGFTSDPAINVVRDPHRKGYCLPDRKGCLCFLLIMVNVGGDLRLNIPALYMERWLKTMMRWWRHVTKFHRRLMTCAASNLSTHNCEQQSSDLYTWLNNTSSCFGHNSNRHCAKEDKRKKPPTILPENISNTSKK